VLTGLAALTVTRNLVWRDEITLWSDVVRRETRHALPYMNLGLALSEVDRLDEAREAYQAALARKANAETTRATYINLGHVLRSQGQLDEAETLFDRANAIGPHASAYYGLGVIARIRARAKLAAGDATAAAEEFARARAALERGLAINPRHQESLFLLASVLYQTGDIPGALAHYRRVVEVGRDTETGRNAAEAIAQLTASFPGSGGGVSQPRR